MKTSDTLICIPCFNSEETITAVVESLLQNTDADILLIDDLSDEPLEEMFEEPASGFAGRVEIVRPQEKVYCGGAKNLGIRQAMEKGYDFVMLVDSDVIVPGGLLEAVRRFFAESPEAVVVAPAIVPAGTPWQYADTLINFSNYLPDSRQELSQRSCLAGYAFALNLNVFAQQPCFHDSSFGGEDVLFFHRLAENFNLPSFPMINSIPVVHLPPRGSREQALNAQRRYGRAFFTHANGSRERLFTCFPWLHFFTPRWWLMLSRVARRQRWSDLRFAAHGWLLDAVRAWHIVRLQTQGYSDPRLVERRTERRDADRKKVYWQHNSQCQSVPL